VKLFRHEAARVSMACVYAIIAYGPDPARLPATLDAAFDEVDRIDRLMSHYKPDSPLSRLNREGARGPVAVEPELFDFIAEALRYSRESGGAFDITVGPLMKAWGFFQDDHRVPADQELRELRSRIGYAHVILDHRDRTIRFDASGVELDLGGIAKGYAVDRVAALLRSHGVASALISAGGSTVFGLGAPPGRKAWEVSLQDPLDPGRVARRVHLRDRAVSVASSAEKAFEIGGVRYAHIMDPRTGRPVQGVLSVAVLTATGTAGDALDNVLFVEGPERSRPYLERRPGTEAFILQPRPRRGWRMIHLRH
jgi:thiamine biosynthesis lipoprotein